MVLTGSTRESTSKVSSLFRFSVLVAISLLIWWIPLIASFALALRDSQYTHILLILPVSVSLMYLEWKSSEISESGSSIGFVLLGAAVVTTIVARSHILTLGPDQQHASN